MSASALVCDQIIGSFAATRTFDRLSCTASSGSPVKGKATELNFKRRSTPSSNANQPFGNCSISSNQFPAKAQRRKVKSVGPLFLCAFAPLREFLFRKRGEQAPTAFFLRFRFNRRFFTETASVRSHFRQR